MRLILLLLVLELAGCAVGQRFDYAKPAPTIGDLSGKSVVIATQDRRPYVISSSKAETFVGVIRGGFGNPFDVATKSNRPFVEDLTQVIALSLTAAGAHPIPLKLTPQLDRRTVIGALTANSADHYILLTVNDWKSDSFSSTSVYFDLTLEDLDHYGTVQRQSALKGEAQFAGHALSINPNAVIESKSLAVLEGKLQTLFAELTTLPKSSARSGGRSVAERLDELRSLHDRKLISDLEYEQKRKELLDSL
jgi:hypothetical protein